MHSRSSSSLVGRIVTDLDDAEPVCCRMSCKGLCCCIMLCPISFYSPTGGLGLMCLITNYLRSRTIEKYGVEETDVCACSVPAMNTLCNFCCYGFHYPCTLFQMNMAIEYWEREDSLTGEKETFIEQNVRSA